MDAGIVAFAIAALGLIASGLAPLTLVLLPAAARMIGRGDDAGLRRNVKRILERILPPLHLGIPMSDRTTSIARLITSYSTGGKA